MYTQENLQFPNTTYQNKTFQFGLEAEFMLVQIPEYRPLWYQDLNFQELNQLLEKISLTGIKGSLDLFDVEPPHKKKMPFVVEGYHIPNENSQMVDILPKGIEIRTPVCNSIEDCLFDLALLFDRMQEALAQKNLKAVCLSHHPVEFEFHGKQNKRRYDYWQWAMEVMTTYGPDINVSVPFELLQDFDLRDFGKKINYYSPALTAISVGSPFLKNELWLVSGHEGKSYRTYKRSVIAPPIEYHPQENNRFEFKVFEMSPYLKDYHNYFLLYLVLFLEKRLQGRSEKYERIYNMGSVAVHGLKGIGVKDKLTEILSYAPEILTRYGFDPFPLENLAEKIHQEQTLADELSDLYKIDKSIPKVLEHVSYLR